MSFIGTLASFVTVALVVGFAIWTTIQVIKSK